MNTATFPGTDVTVSRLGFGCMRLPTIEKDGQKVIDEPYAIEMIRYAIDHGVTYIDTAYPYHGGASELVVAKALADGYRDKVVLATKLPVWLVKTEEDLDKYLDEQLKKLNTDHIDFYLMHAMNKERLELLRKLNYQAFLDRAVKSGKIRFPAFSFHDGPECFLEILNDYDWKMAQVQMNILDGDEQACLSGIQAAYEKGVGIVIMEPLRGGMLAKAPADVNALYEAWPVKRSPVEWAFRYLYDMPAVVTILSGMSDWDQLKDNLRIFEDASMSCMSAEEKQLMEDVKKAYLARMKTGCTGCRYCQPCPRNVHIPDIFRAWDESLMFDRPDILKNRMKKHTDAKEDPGQCIECGMCEGACPQHLSIIDLLKQAADAAR